MPNLNTPTPNTPNVYNGSAVYTMICNRCNRKHQFNHHDLDKTIDDMVHNTGYNKCCGSAKWSVLDHEGNKIR